MQKDIILLGRLRNIDMYYINKFNMSKVFSKERKRKAEGEEEERKITSHIVKICKFIK